MPLYSYKGIPSYTNHNTRNKDVYPTTRLIFRQSSSSIPGLALRVPSILANLEGILGYYIKD